MKVDGFVKSPSAALRFTFVVAAYHPSTPHSSCFARLASGAFYAAIALVTFYETIKVRYIHYILIGAILNLAFGFTGRPVLAETCEAVVQRLNHALTPPLDEDELVFVLRSLNATGNKKLLPQFVTKNQARKLGWKPGRDLWESKDLRGRSIGGMFSATGRKGFPTAKESGARRTWLIKGENGDPGELFIPTMASE